MPKLDDEKICSSVNNLDKNEKLEFKYNEKGDLTEIKKVSSDCYVITACYGLESNQLKTVKSKCKNLFVKNIFLFPFWFLYKYVVGEELAYLYSKGIYKKFIKSMIAEKILQYTKRKSLSLQIYLILLGTVGLLTLPVFLIIKSIRIMNEVIQNKISVVK
jgi:hypothetical protein